MKHAKYSASGAHRWMACPGSIKLSETVPPPPSTAAADHGTQAHACVSQILAAYQKLGRDGINISASSLRSMAPAAMVRHAVEAVERVIARLTPFSILLSDMKVHVDGVGFGTIDVAIIEEFESITVIDYKYGLNLVEVENNLQCQYYAIGLASEYFWNFEKVRLVIDQPRAYHKLGPVREFEMSITQLKLRHHDFRCGVAECEEEEPTLIAGDHCKYCPAAFVCPEVKNKALRKAQKDFL